MSKNNFPSLAFAGLLSVVASVAHAMPSNFGVPAYWDSPANTYSGQVPKGAYIVINPNSGALKLSSADIIRYKAIIASIRSQGGRVLGYVPTGYSEKPGPQLTRYSNIGANLAAYKTTLGGVDGIFFDEAAFDNANSSETPQLSDSQKCSGTKVKWEAIRSTLKTVKVSGTFVWNAGTWGNNNCFVNTAAEGEHIVILEDSYSAYSKNLTNLNSAQSSANGRGVKTWLLTYAATQSQMKSLVNATTANYVFVTDQPNGGTTWNYTPAYWNAERALLNK